MDLDSNPPQAAVLDPAVAFALSKLPSLTREDIPHVDDACPICLLTFRSLLDSPPTSSLAGGSSSGGVTRVEGCGHIFCIEDLSEWIRGRHGTCPTCRHPFLPELKPVDSDDESSDGGEYVPTEYYADSDYFDTDPEDGFLDSEGIDIDMADAGELDEAPHRNATAPRRSAYRTGLMESDVDGHEGGEAWWRDGTNTDQEWGLTDGDSMSASEGEMSLGERPSGTHTLSLSRGTRLILSSGR
ncbi:hypothetical protein OF83DRAFT_1049157 [Amylostereum chailletii]|nr:hypothetical protein OF83DRAFT_1049157 [Amylostereum chailletii]